MLVSGREQELTRRQQETEENRQYLARLVDVTKTLAKCGLAFRGNDESINSCNRGNFCEVVDLIARWDTTLSRYMANSPRNCTYLSNRSQNDLIQAMEEIVSENIITQVKSAGIYTVMMDETTDISGKEQASLILRFVDKEENIQERLISVSCVTKTDAETLFTLLRDTLHSKGLEISQIRGQCYDGASNMSGKYNGVQARVKAVDNRAVYIHCYAHCLNLVLVDTVKRNKKARNFFGVLQSLYCFVQNSTFRHSVFQSLQMEVEKSSDSSEVHHLALKKVCETRWACRFEAIRAVEANFSILLHLLETIEDDPSSDAKAVADARGLRIQIKSFEFLIVLLVLKHLFEHTNVTSRYLQSVSIDLNAAISSVQATQSILKKFREDGTYFHKLFEAAETICNSMGCEVPSLANTRRRKVSRRLDQMWENEQEFDTLGKTEG